MDNRTLNQTEKINELLKVFVDSYLKRKNIVDSTTDLKNHGLENERGKLYTNQVLTLQTIIQEELAIFGIDLAKLLAEKGIQFKPGELSTLEQQYVNNKVNNILGILAKMEEIKANKQI